MKTIAVLCGRYLPGYKDGGPVRTLINLTDCFGERYRFKVITNDRDHGDTEPYPNIKYDAPNYVRNAEVWYLQPGGFSKNAILKSVADADLIYVFGPFNDYAYKTMWLKKIGKIRQPVYVASMGSFSHGAFQIKNKKKQLFIKACKLFGIFKKIIWSVTSNIEKEDVQRTIGQNANCIIAEDLPRKVDHLEFKCKESDRLKVIFLSRICKKKNLSFALEILKKVQCKVDFDIFGNIEDKAYWDKCKKIINDLPDNVNTNYVGIADSNKVIELFSNYDVFLFPTLGENYGHVIFEALAGGCIPIISDQTPWNDLETNNCGIAIPLTQEELFVKGIEKIADLKKNDLIEMKQCANQYAQNKYRQSVANSGYKKIFD